MLIREWTRFGWQGIEFDAPADWNLGRIEGDRTSGYLRLDDEEIVRLEAKWAVVKKGRYDLDRELERQVKELEKNARKAKIEIAIHRKVKLVRLDGRDWECFTWRGDYDACNLLTCCHSCGRVILLRALFRPHEPAREISRRIFESLADHQEDCCDLWNVFGLTLRIPASFLLKRCSLKTGDIRLAFSRHKEELEAARISLAQYQLRESRLDHWFERYGRQDLEAYEWNKTPQDVRKHPGYRYLGTRKLGRRLFSPFASLTMKSQVWHCQASDKLFILRGALAEDGSSLFEDVLASVQCH